MNILKYLCFIFLIALTTNTQTSEFARHVKFKSPLITRHKYEIESLAAYSKELREHNLQISMQQDAIISEMPEEEKVELAARQAAKLLIDEQKKAFLEPYNKINNATKFNAQEFKKHIQEEQRVQKQNRIQEQCNSRLRTLSVIIVGGVSLYYFNYYK